MRDAYEIQPVKRMVSEFGHTRPRDHWQIVRTEGAAAGPVFNQPFRTLDGAAAICRALNDAYRAGAADAAPRPAPAPPAGTSWAFRNHRTMAEVMAEEQRDQQGTVMP